MEGKQPHPSFVLYTYSETCLTKHCQGMSIKTYILDTNVLLTDANALFSFEEHNLVLPLIVLEELDKHKDRQDEAGRNARETVRKLTELVRKQANVKAGISLGNGLGTIQLLSTMDIPAHTTTPEELVKVGSGDNTIIQFCLSFKAAYPEKNPILVTRDLMLQIKSTVVGIVWENYRKFNVAPNASSLYNGCATINNVDVDEFYKAQDSKQPYILPEELVTENNLHANQFLVLSDGNRSALARFTGQGKELKEIKKFQVGKFLARNKEQEFAMDLLFDESVKLVTLVGRAGCGKTLLSIAAGLEQVVGSKKRYKNLLVCRPVQPVGKDIGYLPGSLEEKMEPWIAPIKDNLRFLISEGKKGKLNEQILQDYFDNGIIEIEAMTFIRGRSIANAFMIIDEAQNLNLHELKTILTRVGENTKIVLTGDIEQIDNMYVDSVSNGLTIAVDRFKDETISGHVTLIKGERSAFATLASTILF